MNEGTAGGDGIIGRIPIDAPPAISMLRKLDINAEPAEYGRLAGEGFQSFLSTWPAGIESAEIRTDERRFSSPGDFWGVWDKAETIVMAEEHKGLRQDLLADKGGDEAFKATIVATRSSLGPLIEKAETGYLPDKRGYFAPYNADHETCIISVDSGGNTVITYDDPNVNIGGARNKVLAEVAAASNFYGRLWEKSGAQQAFLKGLLSGAKSIQELDKRRTIAQSVATFGTIHMSKYPMNPKKTDKRELPMANDLITNLPDNLKALELAYESQKASLD